MYNNTGTLAAGAGAGGSGLAMTGVAGNLIWLFLASFAILALGMAILRTVPRSQR